MTRALSVLSASRAVDAGYLALFDLAETAKRMDVDYRIVGGHMVSTLCQLWPTGVELRETADADFGATFQVVADPRLPQELARAGYEHTAGNRFERTEASLDLAIDILVPSYTTQHQPNQRHGSLVVDAIPGLSYALAVPPLAVQVDAELTSGRRLKLEIPVPPPAPALCLKAVAYGARLAQRDAQDVHRLLEVAVAAGVTTADLAGVGVRADARRALRTYFGSGQSAGCRDASGDQRVRTRIAALVNLLVPDSA